MNLIYRILIVWAIIPITFLSCNKDEIQAEKSLEGGWDVIEITSIYGEFFENGFDPSETITESGALGTFDFTGDSVDFDFTRNDTSYTGTGKWNIIAERIREGFIRVPEFTITIENQFLFEAHFDDGTKNSEKNANRVSFVQTPINGIGVLIEMFLEKR